MVFHYSLKKKEMCERQISEENAVLILPKGAVKMKGQKVEYEGKKPLFSTS